MARKSKKKTGIVSLDFSGVEARVLVKEGEYLVKVAEVTEEDGDKAPYLKWKFEIGEGKFEGSALYYITSLSEKSLWNLKSLLEALNVELPEDAVDLDLSEMVDLELMVTVEHDTYEGKKQARIVDFWAADGDKDDDDGKKKGKKKDKKGGKKKTAEKPDEDAINDMDAEELAEVIEEHSLEIDPDDFPKVKALRKEVIKALEEAGDGEDEEEDDDNKGKKNKKGGKKGKKKAAVDQDAINEMDEDELEAFVEEHELDIKLSKYKTLRKKQAAVIDAGTEAGVVED